MCVIPKATTWRAFKYQTSAFLKQYYHPATQSASLTVALSTATVTDVPPDEGFLYDVTAVTSDTIKGTLCSIVCVSVVCAEACLSCMFLYNYIF